MSIILYIIIIDIYEFLLYYHSIINFYLCAVVERKNLGERLYLYNNYPNKLFLQNFIHNLYLLLI